jgi:hypothetical protein
VGFAGGIAVDASHVYWADGTLPSTIFSAPIAGGSVTTLATNETDAMSLVVDATNLYWVGDAAIKSVPLAGGTPSTLWASSTAGAPGLTRDGAMLYWSTKSSTNRGAVMKMPVTGGPPALLGWNLYFPGDLVVDDAFVYVTEGGGSVSRMPK